MTGRRFVGGQIEGDENKKLWVQRGLTMASQKQIAANQANAKRSTGPKTARGKVRSGRNALRHGLSLPMVTQGETLLQARRLAQALMGKGSALELELAAATFASAQAEAQRVRSVRVTMMRLDCSLGDPQALKRLAALDRYERLAIAKRRRAEKVIRAIQGVDEDDLCVKLKVEDYE